MWRWIIRTYVSLVVFVVLMFVEVVGINEVSHLLAITGFSWPLELIRTHLLLTALLAGVLAGQVPVDSRLTGKNWFRSKDGKSFEGFKLEELRPWTWLFISAIFLLVVVLVILEEAQGGEFSIRTFIIFCQEAFTRNCSEVIAHKNYFDESCNTQMVLIAPWVASIGYSLGPMIRGHGARLAANLGFTDREGTGSSIDGRSNRLMRKTDSQ